MPRYISYANFTDYRPNCFIENDIQTKNGIKNSFDYRMFLIKNTERLGLTRVLCQIHGF